MAEELDGYKWLEYRPHPIRKSPYIKGTRINVGILMVQYNTFGYKGPKDLARDRDLPLEAIIEAIDWYRKNKDIVTQECAEVRRFLGVED